MSLQDANTGTFPTEPIPGYRLLERIGRGGYGEVWKTIAPGGVPKAIKLIFGDDSSRMGTELRSLNRIKDVRHPFLLSIERIEHNGDLLAIVTELGDKNLQQHFQDCQSKGLPGVPQDELLEMMTDVADVLDYIYEEYALQHLDIKPANLLMFGKRLKVADFGLVKNIYERSASLVQGLTPTYAAPEIFEGQPTRACDQYSLAILYQEMLTGSLPFNGMSAARLATQHLQEAPDLSSLPPNQRPVIARALSKDPARRFSNCAELINQLKVAAQRPAADADVASKDRPRAMESVTRQAPTPAAANSSVGIVEQQVIVPGSDRDAGPTIVIGIGGSAGKVLQRLRLRIGDRLAGGDAIPALKMLFLDLDHESLNEVNQNQKTWNELETVPTPLHSSADYREQGHLHRRWLSRRWLFNIPRNHRTDGLRPLGRLALLSNAKRVIASLQSGIAQVANACPGQSPRVLLVASISGGTGSGMLLDVAYAAGQELRNAGFPDAPVDSLLLHSTPVGPGRDKAVLNAVATLFELDQYSAPGSFYPGEPLLQVPPFHGNNQTFRSTQFLHLGEDLDGSTFLRAIDNVAELLYCRLVTNLDQVLDAPRTNYPHQMPTVDLVQARQIGGYAGSFVDDLTRQLCVDLIDSWCGSRTQMESNESRRPNTAATLLLNSIDDRQNEVYQKLAAEAQTQLVTFGIDVNQLLERARRVLQEEMKCTPKEFLETQFAELIKTIDDDVPDHDVARMAINRQDRAIGLDFGEIVADNNDNKLFDLLQSRLISQAMPIASRIAAWIGDLVDQQSGGVDVARIAAEAGRDHIRQIISVLGSEIRERQTQQTASRIQIMLPPGPNQPQKKSRGWLLRRSNPRAAIAEKLIEHGLSSFEELAEVVVQTQLRAIEANLLAVIDHLLNMWHELRQLGKRIGCDAAAPNSDRGLPTPYERSIQKWLLEYRPRLVQVLRGRIEDDVLSGPKKLQRFLQQPCSYDEALGDPLKYHARQVILHGVDYVLCSALQTNVKGMENHNQEIRSTIAAILQEPWPMGIGDAESAAVVVPSEARDGALCNSSFPKVPILVARTNNVAVCRVRRAVTIHDVIDSITHGQDALLKVAANLHARIDVEWKPHLSSAKQTADYEMDSCNWGEVSQTVPLDQLELAKP